MILGHSGKLLNPQENSQLHEIEFDRFLWIKAEKTFAFNFQMILFLPDKWQTQLFAQVSRRSYLRLLNKSLLCGAEFI